LLKHTAAHVEAARDAAHVRRLNLERVLAAAIGHEGEFTRAELIKTTGLSAPTVGGLSSTLIRLGILNDLGAGPSRGGRRPGRMQFNASYGFVAGIDIGPSRTRLGLADLRGELLARRVLPTPADADPQTLLRLMSEEIDRLGEEGNLARDRLLAVAVGVPGIVDPNTGTLVGLTPNLKGWAEAPVGAILSREIGVAVVVENDVNLAILGEHWKGAARGHDTCVFLTFGTGIGAGIMMNGQLHHGHHFLAGEIGMMCMGPQFVGQDFGSRGCLETLSGLGALKANWSPVQNESAANSPDWVAELFRAAATGDEVARKTIEDAGTVLGIAAANVCSVLDPSLVVLGGSLAVQGAPLVDRVRQIIEKFIFRPPSVVVSALDKDAPLWGSLLLATSTGRERVRERLRQQLAPDRDAPLTAAGAR
jgi:glucokinase